MAMNYDDRDREVTFEIVEEIGTLSTSNTGWTKELNLVSWNGNQAKYDIREWDPSHDRMGRGLTLNEQEMRNVLSLMQRRARSFYRRGASRGSLNAAAREETVQSQEPLQEAGFPGADVSGREEEPFPLPMKDRTDMPAVAESTLPGTSKEWPMDPSASGPEEPAGPAAAEKEGDMAS